jgi:hypothetical protein
MDRLRETINPDEMGIHEGPTRYRTEKNNHALHCRECGDLYHVDEKTIRRVLSALEGDPSENPFCCPRCEEEYEEEAYRH